MHLILQQARSSKDQNGKKQVISVEQADEIKQKEKRQKEREVGFSYIFSLF